MGTCQSLNSKKTQSITPPFKTPEQSTNSNTELDNNSIKSQSKALYYPNKGVNETVIKIEIDEKEKSYPLNNEFIFILDISGSMEPFVTQILTKVIPKVYENSIIQRKKKSI